eukprot:scaffold5483_cov127-Isochrysis_galbana.AAC.1
MLRAAQYLCSREYHRATDGVVGGNGRAGTPGTLGGRHAERYGRRGVKDRTHILGWTGPAVAPVAVPSSTSGSSSDGAPASSRRTSLFRLRGGVVSNPAIKKRTCFNP